MTDDALLGQQLDEYRIETLLGRGGMARIYRALDVRLKRYVAIKVIDVALRSDSAYTARFEIEAQAIAKLEHPHIVRLYRYGEVEGLLYMAMQFVEGSDLGTVLTSYRQDGEFIEPQDAIRIIRQVCQALDYAHSKGVIHRDVKPSNIMLDKQGQAYLTDFGLALLTEIGTRGEILGSPHYVAPEQAISSAGAVPQSDLYAVGVILYEMLTGQLPFDAAEPLDIAMQHMTEPPRPPGQIRPELGAEIEAVILKTLDKEPAHRYPDGAALADALDRALRVTPTQASRLTVHERVALDMGQHPLPPVPAAVATPPPPSEPEATSARKPPASESAGLPKQDRRIAYLIVAAIGAVLIGLVCLSAIVASVIGSGLPKPTAVAQGTSPLLGIPVTAIIQPSEVPSRTPPTSIPFAQTPLPATIKPSDVPSPAPATSAPATQTLPAATKGPVTFDLLLVKHEDDSLFLVNQSKEDFPVGQLRLGDDSKDGVTGAEWGVEMLKSGECVTAWKNTGNPAPPDVRCSQVGQRVMRDGKRVFWKSTFNVYYAGKQVGACDKDRENCSIRIVK